MCTLQDVSLLGNMPLSLWSLLYFCHLQQNPICKKLKCIVPYVKRWMFYIPYFLSESIMSDLAKEVIWTNFLIPLKEKTCLIIWCHSPFQYIKKPENYIFIHLLNEYLLSFWCVKAQVWFLSFIIFSRHKPLHLLSIDFFLVELYWSIIASLYCVSFCCTPKWVNRVHTYVPISPPPWASLASSLSHPSRSSQSTELISLLLPTS